MPTGTRSTARPRLASRRRPATRPDPRARCRTRSHCRRPTPATRAYPAALPGVDVRLAARGSGVKEDLLLTGAQAPTTFGYTLALTGLTPRLDADGTVRLLDGTKVVGVIPAGTITDARQTTGAVRYTLAKAGNGWTLGLSLDAGWLHDPSRAFPVDVDPSAAPLDADT